VFVVLQHPYINNLRGIVIAIDAKCVTHLKDI
jgi:hypothetical protein